MNKNEQDIITEFLYDCSNEYFLRGEKYDISDVFTPRMVALIYDALVLLKTVYNVDIDHRFPILSGCFQFFYDF